MELIDVLSVSGGSADILFCVLVACVSRMCRTHSFAKQMCSAGPAQTAATQDGAREQQTYVSKSYMVNLVIHYQVLQADKYL